MLSKMVGTRNLVEGHNKNTALGIWRQLESDNWQETEGENLTTWPIRVGGSKIGGIGKCFNTMLFL